MTNENDNSTGTTTDVDKLLAEKHAGLIDSHKKALEQLSALRSRTKDLPDDFDPAEFNDLRKMKEERERDLAVKRGEFEKLTEKLKAGHAGELAKRAEREKQLTATIEKNLLHNQALSAINAEDGISKVLLPHVVSRLRMAEVDGEFKVEALDDDGMPMEGKSIADLVKLMKADKDYATCFRSGQKSGTGSQSSVELNNGTTVNPFKQGASFNMTEQARVEKTNPALAQRLRSEAGMSW